MSFEIEMLMMLIVDEHLKIQKYLHVQRDCETLEKKEAKTSFCLKVDSSILGAKI